MARWGDGQLWGSGQLWAGSPTNDSRGRISAVRLEVPVVPSRGRIANLFFQIPETVRGRISNLFFQIPERARGRISKFFLSIPLPPAHGRISNLFLNTPTRNRRGRIAGLFLELPLRATRGRIANLGLTTPIFNRIGRIAGLRYVIPSPQPGTGGPLPDTPETPGGLDPDTGRPVLVEFNRMLDVQFASSPDQPRGKVSWAHTGGVQARSVASAGFQWVEQYIPAYMTDQTFWAFVAYCRDLVQNERIFMIRPPQPLRAEVFGSVSGTPVVSGAGQTGYNLVTSGWTGSILAGNILQIDGIHSIFEVVTDATSADPTLQLNPQIREGSEPQDGATIFLGPDVRLRAKIDEIDWPEVHADDAAMIGLRIRFREVP